MKPPNKIPNWLKDPEAIYQQSFEQVRAMSNLDRFGDVAEMVIRIVHACGMPDIADDIQFSDDVMAKASGALASGAPILCDCAMLEAGITKRFLPGDNRLVMTLNRPETKTLATALNTTRSAAAVEAWRDDIKDGVVVIGNAPTALFQLLERLDEGWPRPAAILAFPVGFVGAAESKALLAERSSQIQTSFITLKGRRGGTAMAAAAVNAAALFGRCS